MTITTSAEKYITGSSTIDCLNLVEIFVPDPKPRAKRCIATVVSAEFDLMLDNMLGSLNANGCCQDALLVVFALDNDEKCRRVIDKYGAQAIHCTLRSDLDKYIKAVLYSVTQVVDAQQFLCLDADLLVLDDLRPVFAALEACPEDSILICRDRNERICENLRDAISTIYGGQESDIEQRLGMQSGLGEYPLVVNDGLYAGSGSALRSIDNLIRRWPQARQWMDEHPDVSWRNQFIFNLALAHLNCGVELKNIYNVQLHKQDVEICRDKGRIRAMWGGERVRGLHFNGDGRIKHPSLHYQFARVPDPLIGVDGIDDVYEDLLAAVRSWVGRFGLKSFIQPFYGASDGKCEPGLGPSVIAFLKLLYHLMHSNGCVRVLVVGTANGVSASYLA